MIQLEAWLRQRLADATGVRVSRVETPSTTGFSTETLIFDAEWDTGGQCERHRYVATVAPTGHQIFPAPRFEEQNRLMKILAGTPVEVPAVHWYEPDPGVLGAPFYVMTWVDGQAPTEGPHVPGDRGVWLPEFARLSAIRAAGWLQAESGPAQGWAGKRYRQRSEATVPPGEGFVLLRPGISAASVDCRRWR